MGQLLALAKRYDLVVGDKFEMFYTGIMRSLNPYKYVIHIDCEKGKAYPRYYTLTPNKSDVGNYELTVSLYNDYHELLEQAKTTLHIVEACKPSRIINILCFGDSLTVNGVWPSEAYRRFCETGGTPAGLGLGECLNMVGEKYNGKVGYTGFGGWKWSEFCTNDFIGISSSVWVKCHHEFTEHDQESLWESNGKKWYLETIEDNRLKFKRGPGNIGCSPNIGKTFTHLEGGIHTSDITVESYQYEETNPFWSEKLQGPSFKEYCERKGFPDLDYVYILLTWNGQYKPFCTDFSHHEKYIRMILDAIKRDYPLCKVGLIGIQSPSVNGGITANYGCHGFYSDTLGDIYTAYNYDMFLEKLTECDEYKTWVRYIDMKAQFDVEHSMPSVDTPVNARSSLTEKLGTNGVHPTMEGYLQIGDAFFRALVSDMKDESGE